MSDDQTISGSIRAKDPTAKAVVVIVWREHEICTSVDIECVTHEDLYEGLRFLFDSLQEEGL
ncbi:MAG TPA: hypothetical protein DIS79_07950 [Bacteroidetes bacterium]|nr:hypothetical protein [Bacteroidota bacterium]HRK04072.1 hypothetical protein [Chlorobiota bacterium]